MVYKIAEAMLTFEAMTIDKLQKLCYFAYAWYLTFFGEKLFTEKFEARENGPVCPELGERYGEYGSARIPRVDKALAEIIEDEELREFLQVVYDAHGTLKAKELTGLACSEEPWRKAMERMNTEGVKPVYSDEEIVNWSTKKVLRELNRENISVVCAIGKQV